MATFQNQATLTFGDNTVNSNVVTGEIVEVLSLTKASLNTSYTPGDTVTYVLSVVNSGTTAFNAVSVTDDLGEYTFDTQTLAPLSYIDGSAVLYVDGIAQPINTDASASQVVFSGFSVPAGGNAIISYRATVNSFASPETGAAIENTATLTATGLTNPVTATATIPAEAAAVLSITKCVSPESVSENGQLTYTLTISNTGSEAASTGVVVSDVFDPILSGITVTYNGTPWVQGVNYTYDETTGVFTTIDGQITVPAATYTQDITSGAWLTEPGSAVIKITGTV